MSPYVPGIETDLLVLNWWHDMATGEDLERTFSVTLAPCGAFMAEMQKCLLVYEADERGIWFAAWFDRAMSAGLFGLYIREDKRHTPACLRQTIEALHFGLERFPVLILATRRPPVAAQAGRLGFQTMGDVPYLFDGEAATVMWLDSEHFYSAVAKYGSLFQAETEAASNG